MNLLLDTHIFLWYIAADRSLPAGIRDLIRDPSNRVHLSTVSLWEALVKARLGKLSLPEQPELYLPRHRVRHGIAALALDEQSVQHLPSLPNYHRDPFDRMLICQALERDLILVTADEVMLHYPVRTLKSE
jgi:PIN domain nuclease of toxin-antitoxin system